jgi:hypothetical protein
VDDVAEIRFPGGHMSALLPLHHERLSLQVSLTRAGETRPRRTTLRSRFDPSGPLPRGNRLAWWSWESSSSVLPPATITSPGRCSTAPPGAARTRGLKISGRLGTVRAVELHEATKVVPTTNHRLPTRARPTTARQRMQTGQRSRSRRSRVQRPRTRQCALPLQRRAVTA